jgi:glycosyltransferase involved in cell wall biosynthesis
VPPKLSIIVVLYEMQREAERTLLSLRPDYQREVQAGEYEVIVVENGSSRPLAQEVVNSYGSLFRYFYLKDSPPSPAYAANFGASQAEGAMIGFMLDGARICTPGIVRSALAVQQIHERPVIATLGWHLGPDLQGRSILHGYSREVEDRLLESIEWPLDGYRLFDISSLAGSNQDGWFGPIAESNCIFMQRETFEEVGGYDERFDFPGGGYANLDFFARVCEPESTHLVIPLGEGTFHQLHGGATTSIAGEQKSKLLLKYQQQYIAIRGRPFASPNKQREYFGKVHVETLRSIRDSAERALELSEKQPTGK